MKQNKLEIEIRGRLRVQSTEFRVQIHLCFHTIIRIVEKQDDLYSAL